MQLTHVLVRNSQQELGKCKKLTVSTVRMATTVTTPALLTVLLDHTVPMAALPLLNVLFTLTTL